MVSIRKLSIKSIGHFELKLPDSIEDIPQGIIVIDIIMYILPATSKGSPMDYPTLHLHLIFSQPLEGPGRVVVCGVAWLPGVFWREDFLRGGVQEPVVLNIFSDPALGLIIRAAPFQEGQEV